MNAGNPKAGGWNFVAEGGQNACYAFQKSVDATVAAANNSSTDLYRNKILRVAKSDIVRGKVVSGCSSSPSDRQECEQFPLIMPTSEASFEDPNLRCILKVVRPLLGPQYVDIPQRATISNEFAAYLWRVAVISGRIAENRANDWDCSKNEEVNTIACSNGDQTLFHDKSNDRIEAKLLSDYTKISIPAACSAYPPPTPAAYPLTKENFLSVEIKPKAGYISCSPLIDPKRRIKFVQTKYWIHQRLMAKGHLKKGWGSLRRDDGEREAVVSSYNPLDLFSSDKNRIQRALRCLLEHPQNNMRVWHDGKIVIGHEVPNTSSSRPNSILRDIFPQMAGIIDLQGAIVHTVSEILVKEPLLSRLYAGQTLDFIDTDGATLIWNHLVQLCDGDLDRAETLVDQYQGRIQTIDDIMKDENRNGLSALCDRIASFQEEVQNIHVREKKKKVIDDESLLDKAYRETSELVGHLNKEESVQLLATRLLSLSMCDLSFFVTLSPVPTPITTSIQSAERSSNASSSGTYSQTEDSPGCLAISHGGGSSAIAKYFYNVKVVDCDMKPCRKLRNREKGEAVMDDLFDPRGEHRIK